MSNWNAFHVRDIDTAEFCSSAWNLWQSRLQKQQHLKVLEDQAKKQRALSLQSKVDAQSAELQSLTFLD